MSKRRKAKIRRPLKSARNLIVVVTSMLVVFVSMIASMLLVAMSTFTGAITLAANWALAVPGTGNPMAVPSLTAPDGGTLATFTNAEVRNFITPTNPGCGSKLNGPADPSCTQQPIPYDASFFPIILFGLKQLVSPTWNVSVQSGVTGLDKQLASDYQVDPTGHFYLTGYSQGGTVLSYFKLDYQSLADQPGSPLPPLSQVTFVMAANPQRPNGGLLERFGAFPFNIPALLLQAKPGIPAPTNTGVKTTDIAIQYDGIADFPEYPINLLADANALAGLLFIHPTYVYPNGQDATGTTPKIGHPDGNPYGYSEADFTAAVAAAQQAANAGQCGVAANHCQVFGDTTYITLPTEKLPLLAPLYFAGKTIPGLTALADLLNSPLKAIIETGYNRTSYGTPTEFKLIPSLNPLTLAGNLVTATQQGISNAIGDLNGTRPPDPTVQNPFTTALDLFSGGTGNPASGFAPLTKPATTVSTPKTLTAKVVSTSTPSTTSNTATSTVVTTSTTAGTSSTSGTTTKSSSTKTSSSTKASSGSKS